MLEIVYTTQFKRDYKLAQKRGVAVEELFKVKELELVLFRTGTHSDLC